MIKLHLRSKRKGVAVRYGNRRDGSSGGINLINKEIGELFDGEIRV